jgi:hypothetical protein
MDQTTSLTQQVEQRIGPVDFRPRVPHYSRAGDFVSIFREDTPYIAERVDEVLTIYLAQDNGRLIGCKIKGVSILARNVLALMHIDSGPIRIQWMLLNAAGIGVRPYYYDVSDLVGTAELSTEEIPALRP